jgi:hypothetical protein
VIKMTPTVHSVSADGVFAYLGKRIIFCVWRQNSEKALGQCAAMLQDVAETVTRGVFVGIVEEASGVPDAAFRESSAKMMQLLDRKLAASVTVIMKAGLMGTALRSVVTGVSMLSKIDHPVQTVGDLPAAAKWAAPFTIASGPRIDPSDLLRMLEEVRARR